jgi:hypothetical protein
MHEMLYRAVLWAGAWVFVPVCGTGSAKHEFMVVFTVVQGCMARPE